MAKEGGCGQKKEAKVVLTILVISSRLGLFAVLIYWNRRRRKKKKTEHAPFFLVRTSNPRAALLWGLASPVRGRFFFVRDGARRTGREMLGVEPLSASSRVASVRVAHVARAHNEAGTNGVSPERHEGKSVRGQVPRAGILRRYRYSSSGAVLQSRILDDRRSTTREHNTIHGI